MALEQVLALYYRYLAAAEPLTDVVYGPEVRITSTASVFIEEIEHHIIALILVVVVSKQEIILSSLHRLCILRSPDGMCGMAETVAPAVDSVALHARSSCRRRRRRAGRRKSSRLATAKRLLGMGATLSVA